MLTRYRPECGVWTRLVPHNRRGKVIENPDFGSEDIEEMNKLVRSDRRTMKSLVRQKPKLRQEMLDYINACMTNPMILEFSGDPARKQ